MTGRRCDMRECEITVFWRSDSELKPLKLNVRYDDTVESLCTVFENYVGKEYIIHTGRDTIFHIPYSDVRCLRIGPPRRLR